MELHWTRINRSTHVWKRSELFKSLGRFNQSATAHRDLDELRVKFSREESSDHVGDLRDQVRLERVTGRDGFRGQAMC